MAQVASDISYIIYHIIYHISNLSYMKCASLRPLWPEVASDGRLMDNISTGLFQHSDNIFSLDFVIFVVVFGQCFLVHVF